MNNPISAAEFAEQVLTLHHSDRGYKVPFAGSTFGFRLSKAAARVRSSP